MLFGEWLGNLMRSRRVVPVRPQGTFVVEANIERTEELRPDRLGPSHNDVEQPEIVNDKWRPKRTLGPLDHS